MVEAEYPTFARAPSYLKEMLLFPYTYGANFVQKFVQASGWKSLDLLYQNFPESSEQILHPEKALRQPDAPSEVPSLEPDGGKDLELSYENVLGEFGLYLYLRNHLGEEEAQTASEGWDGDHATIYLDAAARETLTLNSVWDSGRDAEEFFEAVQKALSNSFGSKITWDRQDADSGKHAIGRAGNREFRLRLDGQAVTLIDRDS
jgi:hypothetical protein